mgnify:CR=1 FL=1
MRAKFMCPPRPRARGRATTAAARLSPPASAAVSVAAEQGADRAGANRQSAARAGGGALQVA